MGDLWTTVDIARELGLRSPAVARSRIKRWREAGVRLDVEIDPMTGVKRYQPEQIRAAASNTP